MAFAIDRISLDSPLLNDEGLGDPIGAVGGTPVPAQRSPLISAISLPTFSSTPASDTVAGRTKLRRQLRSLFNNSPLKLTALYIAWDDDTEANGWYVPDTAKITEGVAQAGLVAGFWKMDINWSLVGHGRTHRRAVDVYARDLRVSTAPRDFLKRIYLTDFAGLSTLVLTYLPPVATDVLNTASGQTVTTNALPAGQDGQQGLVVSGQVDLATLSFEQPEANRNQGAVLVYDRRGLGNMVLNPSFEGDLTGWSNAGGLNNAGATLTRVTAQNFSGAAAMQIVTTNALAAEGTDYTFQQTFQSGVAYSLSVYMKGNAGGESISWGLFDGGSGDSALTTTVLTNGWVRYTQTWTPSANRSSVHFLIRTSSAAAVTFFVDAVQVTPGALLAWSDMQLGPEASWEEVYGPDYPYTSGDVPILDNGRCRVRWIATIGLAIDVWTGTAWVEQGRVTTFRVTAPTGNDTTIQSASLLEYNYNRAIVQVVLSNGLAGSRETMILTLQRGWSGPRIEVYPAPQANGTASDAGIAYYPISGDANDSVVKIDASNTGAISATAGSGSALLPSAGVGAATFTGENEAVVLRQGAAYQVNLAVVQVALANVGGNNATAYGSASNYWYVSGGTNLGYASLQLAYVAAQADQILEAESITLGTGTTSVADANASAGNAAQASRTTDANFHVSRATWPNSTKGKYRVFVRLRALTANDNISVYAKTTTTTGATQTGARAATFAWVDLGDIVADGSTLEIHAWNTTAARTFNVDRIEAFLLEDRTATIPNFAGARDLGQSALTDSRTTPNVVAR